MKLRKNIVIWGASGLAKKVVNVIESSDEYDIIGFIDNINSELKGEIFCGRPILGGKEVLDEIEISTAIAFGFGNCHARLALCLELEERGFQMPAIIHKDASVAGDINLGKAVTVCAGAILEPNVKIGNAVFINTKSSIGHDGVIGNGCHLGPGTTICGHHKIGDLTWIGAGSTVIDHINIGNGSFIGAGSTVVKDIPEGVLAFGSPAKVKKPIDKNF